MTKKVERDLIEKAFLQTLVEDLGDVVILDGVDELPDGYLIRSHDLRGMLPEVLIPKLDDLELREKVALEACKMYAVTRRCR